MSAVLTPLIDVVLVLLAVWVSGRAADDMSARSAPSALPLLSYQVPSLKQDDHELPELQFGLQFTAVRSSSPEYTRRLSCGANTREPR
jgi:hypothetical protein